MSFIRRTPAEDVRKQGVGEDIWAYEGRSDRGIEKTTLREASRLVCSPNIIRVIKSRGMRRAGEKRGECIVWMEKPEGKSTLVRPRRRWKDNTIIIVQEVGKEHEFD